MDEISLSPLPHRSPPSPRHSPKLNAPAPRSILKNPTSKKRGIQWDEANLAKNESEKVPRMKVDEPKTPYHPPWMGENESAEVPLEDFLLDSSAVARALGRPPRDLDVEIAAMNERIMKDGADGHEQKGQTTPPESPEIAGKAGPKPASSSSSGFSDRLKDRIDEWENSDSLEEEDDQDDEEEERKKDPAKHAQFMQMRKQHYNMAQALKAKHFDDEDEDEN